MAEMRLGARRSGWLLRRFLRRSFKVLVGDLQVMLRRDQLAVAQTSGVDVERVGLDQFRLTSGAEILEEFWPCRQASTFDDSEHVSPQVLLGVAIASDGKIRPFRSTVERNFQVLSQFGEKRNPATLFSLVMFGLRRVDQEASTFPIHITPSNRQRFAGRPQSAESSQSENQPPLVIGTRLQDLGGIFQAHEVFPRLVRSDGAITHVGERVLGDDSLALNLIETDTTISDE